MPANSKSKKSLNPGDKVITTGYQDLVDGQSIAL